MILADEFRERFPGWALWTTGSLTGDVVGFAEFLEGCYADVSIDERPWKCLNEDDPIQTIITVAGNLFLLYGELREQGFYPPSIDHYADPFGFLKIHAAYLRSIAGGVMDIPRVVH